MAERTVHVSITGRVQGVGYRAWTEAAAAALDLTGWVRNRRDGSVEAVFSGDSDSVQAMLKQCNAGPRHARVDGVRIIAEPYAGDAGPSFRFRPTTE